VIVSVADLAYIAGLIDGEGYIGATRRSPLSATRSARYCVRVSVEMTDREPIAFLAERFASLELIRLRKRAKHYKPIYVLNLEHHRAEALLRAIAPYLVGKQRQAALALSLADLRAVSRSNRTKVVSTLQFRGGVQKGRDYRLFGLSDDFIAQCDEVYRSLLHGSARSGQGRYFACK
jgi:hypothetical protein